MIAENACINSYHTQNLHKKEPKKLGHQNKAMPLGYFNYLLRVNKGKKIILLT